MVDTYRSYVVRVRRRQDPGTLVRLDVEDLLHGGRGALSGDRARQLADGLELLVGDADASAGPAADGRAPGAPEGPGGDLRGPA